MGSASARASCCNSQEEESYALVGLEADDAAAGLEAGDADVVATAEAEAAVSAVTPVQEQGRLKLPYALAVSDPHHSTSTQGKPRLAHSVSNLGVSSLGVSSIALAEFVTLHDDDTSKLTLCSRDSYQQQGALRFRSGSRISVPTAVNENVEQDDDVVRCRSEARRSQSGHLTMELAKEMDISYSNRVSCIVSGEDDLLMASDFYCVDELAPVEVWKNAFAHLAVDPDGGLLNLDDSVGQYNKIPLLIPDPPKLIVAAICTFFAVFSPVIVLHHASITMSDFVHHYSSKVEPCSGIICRWLHLRWNVVTYINFSLSIAIIETVLVLLLLAGVVRWLALSILASCAGTSQEARKMRFFGLSHFTFHHFRRLQNVSVLNGLSFWHPCLVGKNYKRYFHVQREAAGRLLAERFLRRGENEISDDELRHRLLTVIAKCEAKQGRRASALERHVEERLHWSFTELILAMPTSAELLAHGRDVLPEIDATVMDLRPRLRLLILLEDVLFLVLLVVVVAFTVVGFFIKIYAIHLLLNQSDEKITWPVLQRVFVLLNQVMGALNIGQVLTERIQVFTMGGTDAVLTKEEYDIFFIYLASAIEKIWSSSRLNILQKIVVTLLFEDDDLQKLIIEEEHGLKSAVVGGARRFMDRHMHHTGCCNEKDILRCFILGARK